MLSLIAQKIGASDHILTVFMACIAKIEIVPFLERVKQGVFVLQPRGVLLYVFIVTFLRQT